MNFARKLFSIAGIYGLIVLLPQYFTEAKTGHEYPPAITHPEFYYDFIGVGVAWQLAFLVISRDPVRYRPLMLAGIVEKWSFAAAASVLFMKARIPTLVFGFAMLDLIFGVLFLWAYLKTPQEQLP